MKLYLSSYRLGAHGPELARMVRGARRVGVVRNALDFSSDIDRLERGRLQEFSDLRRSAYNLKSWTSGNTSMRRRAFMPPSRILTLYG
jgi:hypothetical protein